ncbi:MAG TPA: GntR family transcriptional regulator [Conexibacter sp.]|jgi:DNA-binding GntR family transcriptional regulator
MSVETSSTFGVQNRTLWEQVFAHLREEILTSRLAPGTEINEAAFAKQLGISRGPLREALGRLAAEGLVTIRPRRGAVVTKLSRTEFMDGYQVREALESLAVKLAVPRLTDANRAELHALADEMVECANRDDVAGFFVVNRRFHDVFVQASGNERLQEMHGQLMAQMGRLMNKSFELRGGLDQSIAEHRAILDAVDAGDATRAARLLEEHIEVPQRVIDSSDAAALFEDEPPDE